MSVKSDKHVFEIADYYVISLVKAIEEFGYVTLPDGSTTNDIGEYCEAMYNLSNNLGATFSWILEVRELQ